MLEAELALQAAREQSWVPVQVQARVWELAGARAQVRALAQVRILIDHVVR